MIISQRNIMKFLITIVLCIIFAIALFLSINTLPPILFTIKPITAQHGDIIRINGIALSNADIPTKVFINDTLVPEEDIIYHGFFSIEFKANVESGAKHVYLRKNNVISKAKLLIIRTQENELTLIQSPVHKFRSKVSFEYQKLNNNNFIIDNNINKIFTHPIEDIQFKVSDTQIIKNICSSTVVSNVMTVELPKHTWNIKDKTTVSLFLPELFWFNYSSVANTYLEFNCKTDSFSFPLTLISVPVSSNDISALYELSITFPKNNGGSYMLPIQNRTQRRITSINSQYNAFLYNYLNSYISYYNIDVSLTITPLFIKNIDVINFEYDKKNISIPSYLEMSNTEKSFMDTIFPTSIRSTIALINTMRNKHSFQLKEIRFLFKTLYQEIQDIAEEQKELYITQNYADVSYVNNNTIQLFLIARILNRYGIIARTMLGATVKKIRNQDNMLVMVPISIPKDLLIWIEVYSKDYGWIAIQNDYNVKAISAISQNDIALEESIQELLIPKNILRLYILEEYLWLEQHEQKAIIPQQITFL